MESREEKAGEKRHRAYAPSFSNLAKGGGPRARRILQKRRYFSLLILLHASLWGGKNVRFSWRDAETYIHHDLGWRGFLRI